MKSVNDVSEQVSTLSPVQIGDLVGEGFASCELASLEAKGEGVTLATICTETRRVFGQGDPLTPFL